MTDNCLKVITLYTIVILCVLTFVQQRFSFFDKNLSKLREVYPEKSKFYSEMVSYHKSIDSNSVPGSFLFIGDSLTQGLCVSCVAENSLNYGIGRDTVFGVINRFEHYHSRLSASGIVFEIGINDLLHQTTEQTISQYLKLIEIIPENIPFFITAIFPIDSEYAELNNRSNSSIEVINSFLKKQCIRIDTCNIIDITDDLKDNNGNLEDLYHVGDGLHLSPDGYRIWIAKLKATLDRYRKNTN